MVKYWKRWWWTLLTGFYALCCLLAGLGASWNGPKQVKMAFVLFSFAFFLFTYFNFFYYVANFSSADKNREKQALKKAPLSRTARIYLFTSGFFSIGLLIWLWWWRNH